MFCKELEYEDFDGNKRTEKFWFHFSKAELLERQMSEYGGFDKTVKKIIDTNDVPKLIPIFKEFILKAYGEKSEDGRRFIKEDPETGRPLYKEFMETQAYSDYFMLLATDSKAAAEFVNGVMPKDMKGDVSKAIADLEKEKSQNSVEGKVVDVKVNSEINE